MKEFISKPFNQGVMAIIGILLSVYLYFISQSYQIPAYILGNPQLIASTPTNKLKIFWDSTQLDNVKVINVAIFNAGNAYIDKSSFSTSYPITIEPSDSARILDFNITKKSRSTLNFKQTKIDTLGKSKIYISIDGDDGLEGGDGAAFEIIYTSQRDTDWLVSGRVKNIPHGFIKPNYTLVSQEVANSNKYESIKFKSMGFVLLLLGLIGFVKITQVSIEQYKKNKSFSDMTFISITLAVCSLAISYVGIYFLYALNVFSHINIPEWLSK